MIAVQECLKPLPELVIHNHSLKYEKTPDQMEDLSARLVSFLDNAAAGSQEKRPQDEVDELWHSFILHSRLYTDWCLERYGHYMHHTPFRKTSKWDCCSCD